MIISIRIHQISRVFICFPASFPFNQIFFFAMNHMNLKHEHISQTFSNSLWNITKLWSLTQKPHGCLRFVMCLRIACIKHGKMRIDQWKTPGFPWFSPYFHTNPHQPMVTWPTLLWLFGSAHGPTNSGHAPARAARPLASFVAPSRFNS